MPRKKDTERYIRLTESQTFVVRDIIREKGLNYSRVISALNLATNYFIDGIVHNKPLTRSSFCHHVANPKETPKRPWSVDVAKALYEFFERDSRLSFLDTAVFSSPIQYDMRFTVSQISDEVLEMALPSPSPRITAYNDLFNTYISELKLLYRKIDPNTARLQLIGQLEQIVESLRTSNVVGKKPKSS